MKNWIANGYAAIRETDDDHHQWLDINTISHSAEIAKNKASAIDFGCGPAWADANRIVRIASIAVQEMIV